MAEHEELFPLVKEQGRQSGALEAMQRTVEKIEADQQRIWEKLDEQSGKLTEVDITVRGMSTTLHDFIKRMDETAVLPAVLPAVQPAPAPSAVMAILQNPAAVYVFALVLVTGMAIVMASALTGRDADDLVPNLRTSVPAPTSSHVLPGDAP
jgi:hypothetical protein